MTESPPRRPASSPKRLTRPDLEAIVDQATDPDASYRVDGWVLMALAGELLEIRAGAPRERAAREAMDLPGQLALPFAGRVPEIGSGVPSPPGTPIVPEPKVKRRRKAKI